TPAPGSATSSAARIFLGIRETPPVRFALIEESTSSEDFPMAADPRRVKEMFAAALELTDVQARQAFLDRECASDMELRGRLEALLFAHDRPQPALDQPLAAVAPAEGTHTEPDTASPTPPAPDEQADAVLAGKYRLI